MTNHREAKIGASVGKDFLEELAATVEVFSYEVSYEEMVECGVEGEEWVELEGRRKRKGTGSKLDVFKLDGEEEEGNFETSELRDSELMLKLWELRRLRKNFWERRNNLIL